jgi:hypothetical protein
LLLDAVDQVIVGVGPGLFLFELGFEFGMSQAQGRQMVFAHRYLLLACRPESRSARLTRAKKESKSCFPQPVFTKTIHFTAAQFHSGDGAVPRLSSTIIRTKSDWGAMNDEGIRQQIESLKIEHRDLDDAISALQAKAVADQLQIARLKRRKLALKDRISLLEDQLIPDIIA